MSRVTITERTRRDNGSFEVLVAFEGAGEYAATVRDPLAADPTGEALLAWYFEQHLRYPFLDKDREATAVARIADYGASLFDQAFGDPGCSYEYCRLRDAGFDGWHVEVVGSTALHRLHWEALRDPTLALPLGVRVPLVRRVQTIPAGFDPPPPRPTLNILVVTARPHGPLDVGYRTISRPLLGAVHQARLPVAVDLVRPGTWAALTEHLEATTRRQGSGWYQVVHFDVHGAVATIPAPAASGYLFDEAQAAGGADAFLFFETDEEGRAKAVPTDDVAGLLIEHRVPVAVLNACQSAMPPAQSEASLAQRLVEAGVPVSVGMAYSVTVSAAALMMPVLYQHLSEGTDVLGAAHAARRRLFAERTRQAYFDQALHLEDWMLPVVYRQRPVEVRLRPFTSAEEAAFYGRRAEIVEEPRPTYGFVGRDLDVQAIERRLLTANGGNELLVWGMAGAGKSTLLAHLAWWWQVTGLVGRVLSFTYEDRAWSVDQILAAIGKVLLDPVDQAMLSAFPEDAQLERIADLLRAERHLLILDNAESITASPAAIPHSLPEPEQARLRRFLSRLRGGKTLVVIGSRGPEEWLAPQSFGINVYELGGLDPQAASVLVERVLQRTGAPSRFEHPVERNAMEQLVALLGGYPLPITVVMPVVATATATDVLEAMRQGADEADRAGLIQRSLDFSHGRLERATQHSLLTLAPFTAVVPLVAVDRYAELLSSHEAVVALGPLDLRGAIEEAVRVGLATPDAPHHVRVQPVLPYFLRNRIRSHPGLAAAVAQAHHVLYVELASELYRLLRSTEPGHRAIAHALTRAEYANLTAAMRHAVATDAPVWPFVRAIEPYLDQVRQQHARRELLEQLIATFEHASGKDRRTELADLYVLAGGSALDDHAVEKAERHYIAALNLYRELGNRASQAGARHNLGAIAQERRLFGEAERHYRQALETFVALGDGHSAAGTHHQLGMVAEDQGHFEKAESNYRTALEMFLDLGDRHSAAGTHHHLGSVALDQNHFEDAQRHFRAALEIYLEFGDRHGAASAYHGIGLVAQRRGGLAEAEDNYRTALEIYLDFDDRRGAAGVYAQVAEVAREQCRFYEAEGQYKKALGIYLEFGDRHHAAAVSKGLGTVAQRQGRFDEAEGQYKQALKIYLELGDLSRAAMTASHLGLLLADVGRPREAVQFSLDALAACREATGQWSEPDLKSLKRHRGMLGANEFDAIVDAHSAPVTSAELQDVLAGVEESPDEVDDSKAEPMAP